MKHSDKKNIRAAISLISFALLIILLVPFVHSQTQKVFMVNGLVSDNNTQILSVKVVLGQVDATQTETNYSLNTIDKSGKIISSTSVVISCEVVTSVRIDPSGTETVADNPPAQGPCPFTANIPFDSNASYISLSKSERELSKFLLEGILCNHNRVCDSSETNLSCPDDCSVNTKDGVCVIAKGLCDPDCAPSSNPDCTQGNITTPVKTAPVENYFTSPPDANKTNNSGWNTGIFIILPLVAIIAVILIIAMIKFSKECEGSGI